MKNLIIALIIALASTFALAELQPVGGVVSVQNLMALPINSDYIKSGGSNGFIFYYSQNRNLLFYQSYDGKTTRKYDIKAAYGDKIDRTQNWSDFTSDGSSIYILWDYQPHDSQFEKCTLTKFDFDGQYRGTLVLDGDYGACYQIAALDGDHLIVNVNRTDGSPVTLIFKNNGQLVKELKFPHDIKLSRNPERKPLLTDRDKKKIMLDKSKMFDDLHEDDIEGYESYTYLDTDGNGNVLMMRRFAGHEGYSEQSGPDAMPWLAFSIDRYFRVHRIVMDPPRTKYGKTHIVRLCHGEIVTISSEQEDASKFVTLWLRVYSLEGKRLQEQRMVSSLGILLVNWNGTEALFGTQAGDPSDKVRHFGLIKATIR